jgi:hypothetical protein
MLITREKKVEKNALVTAVIYTDSMACVAVWLVFILGGYALILHIKNSICLKCIEN